MAEQDRLFETKPAKQKRSYRFRTPIEEWKYREMQKRQAVLCERLDRWIDRIADNKEKLEAHARLTAQRPEED